MANFELNIKVNGVEQTVSTIGQIEKALADTNAELQQVEKNSREFRSLQTQASNLEKVLGALTDDAKSFDNSLKGVNNSAKNLNTTFNSTAQAANSLEEAGQSTKNISNSVKEATTSSQSLRAELRQIVQELQQLEPGSARFQELSVRAGELRDTIGDTQGVVNALAGSTTERLGRALSSTAQVGIAGFQGIVAAQALFGSESEAINETLVKLTALLNLSQAIETFGGLGDRVTQITAGFKSLFPAIQQTATATATAAVATTADATATVGATTATSAWAVALNALPLVAIVTAIGLLVAGLIEYASGSDEAAKAEEERKKKLDEQKAAIDGVIDSTSKEGTGLVTLLSRLKATNAGSKERAQLIKEINDNYGVGLKNLQDEEKFQNQVTDSVKEYITQLKNKVAAQLVEAQISDLLKQQIANQRELETLQGKINFNQSIYVKNLGSQFNLQDDLLKQSGVYLDQLQSGVDFNRGLQIASNNRTGQEIANSQARQSQLQKENDAIQKQIENLGVEAQKYATSLQNAFEKTSGSAKNTSKDLEDIKQKQNEALNSLQEFIGRTSQAENELQRQRVQRTVSRVDDIEFERDIALSAIIQEYEAQKKSIEDNVKDVRVRNQALIDLEVAYQKRLGIERDRTNDLIDIENTERLKKQKDLLQDLLLAEKILQQEITFGNNNVGDSLIALDARLTKIQIDRLDRELENNDLSLTDFETKQRERLLLQEQYANLQLQATKQQIENENQFQLAEIVKYYNGLNKFIITQDEQTGKFRVELNENYLNEIGKNGKKAQDDAQAEAISTENVINQTAINLNKEANVKKSEADAEYENGRKNNAKKTEDEILSYRLNLLDKWARAFANFGNQIVDLATAITEGLQMEEDKRLAKVEESYANQESTINESYNNQLANLTSQLERGLISQEQYNKSSELLELQRTDAIKSNQKSLDRELFKSQKEAFEREKKLKIASAIIAGIQGAVQAFTGAFQLGPIAGPIVGGILAALVAATTAVQVANIRKTQLEAPSTTEITQPNSALAASAGGVAASSLAATGGGFTSFNENVTGTPTNTGGQNTTGSGATFQKVYVLESDITDTQNRVRVLESNASFG